MPYKNGGIVMSTKKRKRKTKIHPGRLEIGMVNENHSLFWPMLTAVILFTLIIVGLVVVAR
jgi:hypothetical protein